MSSAFVESFNLPVGPKADEEELLYISALHQTGDEIRENGSIRADDISLYLLSRHGIKITLEEVQRILFTDIIGTANSTCSRKSAAEQNEKDDNNDGHVECLDLIEIIALIFIPTFCKMTISEENAQGLEKISPQVLDRVLAMILHDVTGDEEPKELTVHLIRSILTKYNENDLAQDDALLQEMVDAAGANFTAGTTAGTDDNTSSPLFLDRNHFVNALTSDILLYDARCENSPTKNWEDVGLLKVQTYNRRTATNISSDLQGDPEEIQAATDTETSNFTRISTAEAIDYVACTYSCHKQVVLTWAFYFFHYMGFIYPVMNTLSIQTSLTCPEFQNLQSWGVNSAPFRCTIANSIVDWILVFASVAFCGAVIVTLASIGTEEETFHSMRWIHLMSTILFLGIVISGPIILGFTDDITIMLLRTVATVLGSAVCYFKVYQQIHKIRSNLPTPNSSFTQESKMKKAAAYKVRCMQENALKIHGVTKGFGEHSVIKAYFGQALRNYYNSSDEELRVGGLLWGWKRYYSENLEHKDGMWFTARFYAACFCQHILCVFIMAVGITATQHLYNSWIDPSDLGMVVAENLSWLMSSVADKGIVEKNVNKAIGMILSFFVQFLGLLDSAGVLKLDCFAVSDFLVTTCTTGASSGAQDLVCSFFTGNPVDVCISLDRLTRPVLATVSIEQRDLAANPIFNMTFIRDPLMEFVSNTASENIVHQMNKIYPSSRNMLVIPAIIATIVAFLASAMTGFCLVPSIINTVLKLRSGLIPMMRKKRIDPYQWDVMLTSYISGVMFWGNLFGSILLGFLFGGIVFLCLWQVTSNLVQKAIAVIIAISLVLIAQWPLRMTCKSKFFSRFYRKRPAVSNVISMLLESINFVLMTAVVVTRMLKLLVTSALYVGRLDIPILAPNVGNFQLFNLDSYNDWFMTDVLLVEAHRHPYLEVLGTQYLLKIKHGEAHINRAGSAWRMIFVTTLMPWLQKYRKAAKISNRTIESGNDERQDESEELQSIVSSEEDHEAVFKYDLALNTVI